MSVVADLQAAHDLIVDPDDWVSHSSAVNQYGESVSPIGIGACRWCAGGALAHIQKLPTVSGAIQTHAGRALNQAAQDAFRRHIVEVNDDLGHAEALAVFRRAIEAQS